MEESILQICKSWRWDWDWVNVVGTVILQNSHTEQSYLLWKFPKFVAGLPV